MSETMIHPETGAILRRRKRMETVTHQGQSRTVEVEGWFPDDEGDGILVGADSKPLDAALAEMKAGWPDPARLGVPLNPERDQFHWLIRKNGQWPEAWRWDPDADGCGTEYSGAWAESEGDGQPEDMGKWYRYLGPCLTPAEVDARVKHARRDALEEAARWHDEQGRFWMEKGREVSALDSQSGLNLLAKAAEHRRCAAAIRALSDTPPDMVPGQLAKQDLRAADCIKQWPECESGAYDPRCCRFPKSCSCESGALKGEGDE